MTFTCFVFFDMFNALSSRSQVSDSYCPFTQQSEFSLREDLAVFVSSVFLQIHFTSAIKIRVSCIYWAGFLKLQIS